jgi:glyoxylase-like metal-dependent hydrolase (beta-lactamase superfamily II)
LDFGASEINQGDFMKETIIVLTHEHLDHWDGLVKKIDLLYVNKDKVVIYSTKTTKLLITALFENYYRSNFIELNENRTDRIIELLSSIHETFYEEQIQLSESLSIELFPSGHTYGSSMVYVKSPKKTILYTSDVDYVKGDNSRQYYFPPYHPSYPVDILLLDATSTYRDYKSLALKEFMATTERFKNLEIRVVPEKSLIFARILNEEQNRKVTIAYDLWWYYKILEDMGYSPFRLNQISFGEPNVIGKQSEKTAFVSSKTGYLKDNKIGLHISLSDAMTFVDQLRWTTHTDVYLTHYGWENLNELKEIANELGYKVLSEGRTNL